ncbi:MAG: FAD-binding protein, partial [Nitrososphaeria archaeon]
MDAYDVVIVGAGLAGLSAAFHAVKDHPDLEVAVVSKVYPLRSHTVESSGAINVAFSHIVKEDTWEKHAFDTVKGSDYLADQDAVEILCSEAPRVVLELINLGALFLRKEDGGLWSDVGPLGGASAARAYTPVVNTGRLLMRPLYERLLDFRNVTFLNEHRLLKLVVVDSKVVGLVLMDQKSGQIYGVKCKACVIATGGFGRLYKHTTNARINSGDGLAIAYKAGIPIEDPEFVQFHPTSLYGTDILVTEVARGMGAYLYNKEGERFMKKYAPNSMERAPRDIVARAIFTEIREGRGFEYNAETQSGYVLLDLRHLGEKVINRLEQVREYAINYIGKDPVHEPLPVIPAAHFTMGGIEADANGTTKIGGVFAAGECACVSVHGANRLGGNALLECLVFGKRAGLEAAKYATTHAHSEITTLIATSVSEEDRSIENILCKKEGISLHVIEEKLRSIMWVHVGLFRSRDSLEKGLAVIQELKKRYRDVYIGDTSRV